MPARNIAVPADVFSLLYAALRDSLLCRAISQAIQISSTMMPGGKVIEACIRFRQFQVDQGNRGYELSTERL